MSPVPLTESLWPSMNQNQGHSYFDLPKPTSSPAHPATHNMPAISEDETAPDADEPASSHHLAAPQFSKTTPPTQVRRNSMLTKALHTDSESHTESHDESLGFTSFRRQPSRSSTCSTWSAPSDMTSEDGAPSLSNSPPRPVVFRKHDFVTEPSDLRRQTPSPAAPVSTSDASATVTLASKPVDKSVQPSATTRQDTPVEEKLGRRRCISFACGGQKKDSQQEKRADVKPLERSTTDPVASAAPREQTKRPCMIKFQCPTKISDACLNKEKAAKTLRRSSPAPPSRSKSPAPTVIRAPRAHRNSDSTIKDESPRSTRKVPPLEPRKSFLEEEEPEDTDATPFAAFASKEEKAEQWTEEKTCHRSRLTVDDYLFKEKSLQKLGEEAEEEAQEEDNDDFDDGMDSDDDRMSDGSGFDTDDEEGFAESDDDDDSDGDSDYEWWAPKKSHAHRSARLAPGDGTRPPALHADDESYESSVSPKHRSLTDVTPKKKLRSNVEPVAIRPPTPELPDSTDFVCGTLDEDKPLEEAYASIIQARKAAKHHSRPQDIDPTFPTDIASNDDDDDDDDDDNEGAAQDSDQAHFLHGSIEGIGDEVDRGRTPHARGRSPRSSPPQAKRSPDPAPAAALNPQRIKSPMPPPSHAALQRRPKSPPPPTKANKRTKSPMPSINTALKPAGKKGQVLRSPPPRLLFGQSPQRNKSPAYSRKISPAPSRRGTPPDFKPIPFGTSFLGQRPSLTHTSSLPRSPNLFARKRHPYEGIMPQSDEAPDDGDDDEEAEDTAKENKGGYERGAIDIVQGLERKRLRRRQKFYERYCRKEEKKAQRREKQLEKQAEKQAELKRPVPGKGAQRMRQVGIECAMYRGKHVLSV